MFAYRCGFSQGTRRALSESGRESLTITVEEVSARSVGQLIALHERAVGLYASLVDINAYHQPGVEAGEKAAGEVLKLQAAVVAALRSSAGRALTLDEVAAAAGATDRETCFFILRHLAANLEKGVRRVLGDAKTPLDTRWTAA